MTGERSRDAGAVRPAPVDEPGDHALPAVLRVPVHVPEVVGGPAGAEVNVVIVVERRGPLGERGPGDPPV